MSEHWTVYLVEESTLHVDLIVGSDTEEVPIERSMMDRTERHPVGHHWLAPEGVLDDVGRI